MNIDATNSECERHITISNILTIFLYDFTRFIIKSVTRRYKSTYFGNK